MWNQLAAHVAQVTGAPLQVQHRRAVGGGSINQAYAVGGSDRPCFVKVNRASALAMFEAEALALQEMAATGTIRVPQPICWGTAAGQAYIVLEWLDLGYGSHAAWAAMGRQLAALHRVTSPSGFGWRQANTIGETPQPNPWTLDWVSFFTQHRLGHQLELGQQRGGRFPQAEALLTAVPALLANHNPQPALVHGDLWSGNAAITKLEEPVIFDPAVYFGDREVDIAMTELFGGFPNDFYRAYNAAFPLDAGYAKRKVLYNLYHILNHFNLFGGGYEAQARRMISTLLEQVS